MKYIGIHTSIKNGIHNSVIEAYNLKATAFSFFLQNVLTWKNFKLKDEEIIKFKKFCIKYNYKKNQILPHSSYLINLGHPNNKLLEKSRFMLINEMKKCKKLGLKFINIHPGYHLKKIKENECLLRISESINIALDHVNDISILIENTSGHGTSLGYRFEHLSYIINNIKNKNNIGVCFDTCHAFSSGYDLRSINKCQKTFNIFNKIIGLKYLKAIHINDSLSFFNSKIDRHQNLGYGHIGIEAFIYIIKNDIFNNIPIILETINKSLWKNEINWLKSLI